jgi:hypothetical protein
VRWQRDRPGALRLIGITQYAGEITTVGTNPLVATVASIFAVATGVLAGTHLLTAAEVTSAWLDESGLPLRRRTRRGHGRRA